MLTILCRVEQFEEMNNWTPLMDSIVDSSLWTEPYYVRVLFVTLMALKDADMIVRKSAFAIAQRAHMTEKEVLAGLKILSSPDKRRLEPQPFEGRRIEKNDMGWLILNGQKYRDIISKMKRRDYQAKWAREKRGGNNEVVLSGKDAAAYEDAKGKSWQKRRKAAEHAGICHGAQDAIVEGLEDANAPLPRIGPG